MTIVSIWSSEAKCSLFQPPRVAGVLRGLAPAFEIAEDAAAAGVAQALDGGVGMLGRVVDLAHVHHGGDARVELRDAAEQLVDVDVLRPEPLREVQQHRLVVVPDVLGPAVVHQDRVRQRRAQRGLELVVVRVDEAGHHDLAARVDHGGVRRIDGGGDLDDPRAFDQHVARHEVADGVVHRHDDPALDERPAPFLAHALRQGGQRDGLRRRHAVGQALRHLDPRTARLGGGVRVPGEPALLRLRGITKSAHVVPPLRSRRSGPENRSEDRVAGHFMGDVPGCRLRSSGRRSATRLSGVTMPV
jgi:hypothetical protein